MTPQQKVLVDADGNPVTVDADGNIVNAAKSGEPRPSGASRAASGFWEDSLLNVPSVLRGLKHTVTNLPDVLNKAGAASLSHGAQAVVSGMRAISPRSGHDRISEAGNAFRQAVGAVLPGTVETGNIAMGMNPEGTEAKYENGKPVTDFARASGKQTAFVSNLLGPEAAGAALKVVKAPVQSRAVGMVQNARKIQDPNAARFLLEQDAAGGPYSKLQSVADAANARTQTVPVAQAPVPSAIVGPQGQRLTVTPPPVMTQLKDPVAWRGFDGLKKSLDRPMESALGREGTAAYLGHTLGGTKMEAAAVGATALARTAPRAKAAQAMFNAVSKEHPTLASAIRAALLAQLIDPNRGGS